MSPKLIAGPTWNDTQPFTLTFTPRTIRQSPQCVWKPHRHRKKVQTACKKKAPKDSNREPSCCEAAPSCPPGVTSEKSFKPWSHFIPITFYWTINRNQPQCHTTALGLKAVGNKLYSVFTGYSSDCVRASGTGCGGSAISFHTALPRNKGTWLRRTIFLL